MIKALVALNEKQKAGGKRGETQAGQCGSRVAALFAGFGLREGGTGQLMDFAVERRVLVWGVRSEATDAPPRAQPRRGTEGGPLVKKQAHVLHSIAHFRVFFEPEIGAFLPLQISLFLLR